MRFSTTRHILFSLSLAAAAARPAAAAAQPYGYLRDRFAGIEHRNTVEAGLARLLFEDAMHKLVVDGSLDYANERRPLDDDISTAPLGAGGVYLLKFSENARFTEDAHFNHPVLGRRRLAVHQHCGGHGEADDTVLAEGHQHVNEPGLGFDSTDMITAVALVAKF